MLAHDRPQHEGFGSSADVERGLMLRTKARVAPSWTRSMRPGLGTTPLLPAPVEVLRQSEALAVVGGEGAFGAVGDEGRGGELFEDEAADGLAVFEDEGHVARADFEHSLALGVGDAEAGIEEAGIVG